MKRIYTYKGFKVTVELEPVWESSGSPTPRPPKGFIAVVDISMAGMTRSFVAPIRLTADGMKPFSTEADALMAGYSAGQRIIDDTLFRS